MTRVVDPDASAPCPCGSGLEAAQCCSRHRFELAASHHDFALGELEHGRPAAAVTALKQALELAPRRASAHNDLGLALKELGQLEEAERAYDAALSLDPTYAAAHRNLGDVLRQRGALEEARRCYESALRLNPALNPCRLDLAQLLEDSGELGPASRCYEEAIARSSAPAGIYIRLGHVLWKLGDSLRALQAFERAVAGAPGSAEAFYNLGCAQLELGRFDAAGRSAEEALGLRPEFPEAVLLHAAAVAAAGAIEAAAELLRLPRGSQLSESARYLLLATRLMNSRLFDPARQCLEAALRADPTEVMAQHLLAALSGANPERPVEGYVRQLFDTSAATFDRDLLSKLGYDIPREMVQALVEIAGVPAGRWNVLDLGCGTGLVGEQIAPHSRRLAGVDLAPNMIERARARGFYTDLHCADLAAILAQHESSSERYDVVTAADVFIYVGKLESVIPAIRGVLSPGGWFAFSAEAVEYMPGASSAECRLGLMGRYAHGADYLRRLAAQSGFRVELLRPTRIRFEHRRPVEGWLTVWRAPQ